MYNVTTNKKMSSTEQHKIIQQQINWTIEGLNEWADAEQIYYWIKPSNIKNICADWTEYDPTEPVENSMFNQFDIDQG
tara:strand:- start:1153 stop:1386 length:234 start_codon:yes stop_codon:yes gene_type:complete